MKNHVEATRHINALPWVYRINLEKILLKHPVI